MRHVRQPGPASSERMQWVEARGRALHVLLQAGVPLLEAVRRGFAQAGFVAGVVNLQGGALGPLGYVMPALSKTGETAAFYSDTLRPAGITRLQQAAMTLGERDGAPFFHCHGFWQEACGRWSGGHILPEETLVAETFAVEAFGLDGASFSAASDPETGFKLFGPVAHPIRGTATTSRAFALRLRPNQDLADALETFCRERGIVRAKVHGGVGSTIGARFADGRIVEPFATEIAVSLGAIRPGGAGAPEAQLEIMLVDHLGGLAAGRLIRGDNPVLMTMELVLEVLEEDAAILAPLHQDR
jgi:predicted DNA-binding protein with PD1-like motif